MLERFKKQATDSVPYRKGEDEMNGRAVQARQEIPAYVRVFEEALGDLIDGRAVHEMSKRKFKDKKTQAFDIAGQKFPLIHSAVAKRRQRMRESTANGNAVGAPVCNDEWELIGQRALSLCGQAVKIIRQSGTERPENVERTGITGLYQAWAWKSDLIPPDHLVALLTGLKDAGISSARRTAVKDGFVFGRVSCKDLDIWQENANHGWWRIVKRPVKEVQPPKMELADVLADFSKDELLDAILTVLKDK